MNSRPFKRAPPRPAKQMDYTSKPRPCAKSDGKARMSVPIPKTKPVVSEAYRRIVASMPCVVCGIDGYSQAAHADEGKGMGLKSCDLTCFPACADRPGVVGCHAGIGTMGWWNKDARRELEHKFAAQTQAEILRRGLWPKSLLRRE